MVYCSEENCTLTRVRLHYCSLLPLVFWTWPGKHFNQKWPWNKHFPLSGQKKRNEKPMKFLEWTIARTLSRGQMFTDVAHLHNPVSHSIQQYLLVDKVPQLQNQFKWWNLFSSIRFHCFILAIFPGVFHIYGHFCGTIFYFTKRLHFLTDRTPSFPSVLCSSQSR